MENILIIQTAFLGDCILTLPIIDALKLKYPDSRIDILTTPQAADIFRLSVGVNTVYELDKRNKHRSLLSVSTFALKLKKNNYTHLYAPHRSFRTAIISFLINTKYSFGYDKNSLSFIYKKRIKYRKNIHEVQRLLDLIGFPYNDDSWRIIPKLNFSKFNLKEIEGKFSDRKYIIVAPGSVWNTKKYPAEYYIKIIQDLLNKNYEVLLVGSKEEKDLCNYIEEEINNSNVFNLSGIYNIVETMFLLRYSRFIICNDSASAHMGVVVDRPVIMIYCSTVPDFGFYPYNKSSTYFSYDKLSCKPCGIHGYDKCPLEHFNCAKLLEPETIINNIKL